MLGIAAAGGDDRVFGFESSNLQGVIELLGVAPRIDIPVIDHRKVEDFQPSAEPHLDDLDSTHSQHHHGEAHI
ncbi:MAG: hypothetical protein DMG15_13990 [Acidobacteria bacterium]|nr:MAG: hypothetical protein DMG16_00315 [Acidobacteriota bacterium]PYS12519.1 MAG: hypothetical protein DMG15_13990 [Acidobacteriota bacterium]